MQKIHFLVYLFLFFVMSNIVVAGDEDQVPIDDGNIAFVVAAGVVYGVWFFWRKRSKVQTPTQNKEAVVSTKI